jgi:hypothetical protein
MRTDPAAVILPRESDSNFDRSHQPRPVVAVPCTPSDRQKFMRVLLGRSGRKANL